MRNRLVDGGGGEWNEGEGVNVKEFSERTLHIYRSSETCKCKECKRSEYVNLSVTSFIFCVHVK